MKEIEKNDVVKYITGCFDCNFVHHEDMAGGASCTLLNEYINQTKKFQLITPKNCPLKTNSYIFKFTTDE